MGDGSHAGRAVRDHDADVAVQLAIQADAVRRRVRPAMVQKSVDHFQELFLINRTPTQLKIHRDMIRDGRGLFQSLDILRGGVDD